MCCNMETAAEDEARKKERQRQTFLSKCPELTLKTIQQTDVVSEGKKKTLQTLQTLKKHHFWYNNTRCVSVTNMFSSGPQLVCFVVACSEAVSHCGTKPAAVKAAADFNVKVQFQSKHLNYQT